jgi:hypothetical protein
VTCAAAIFALGACTDLPDRTGPIGECVQVDAAAYGQARERRTAFQEIDLTGGGYRGHGAGHNMQRCWPRVQGLNSAERRCVQRNDLVVEMRTDAVVTHYRIPAHTTYMLYGEAGQARCRIVMGD